MSLKTEAGEVRFSVARVNPGNFVRSPLCVGGCVRDRLAGVACKDIDIEVFQMQPQVLTAILSKFGKVDWVGVSFGVIKLNMSDGMEYDFILPRRESKSGSGHRGFIVEVDHSMTIEEAAAQVGSGPNSRRLEFSDKSVTPLATKMQFWYNADSTLVSR